MDKVREIIRKDFDWRMESMVVSYIIDKGVDFCSKITDEEIKKIEGNGLMTADFLQSMIRTARRIARECSLYDDIIPFIIMEMPNNNGISWHRMNEIASKAIDGLIEDGEEEAKEYFRNEMELDEDEVTWFGIEDLYEEDDDYE